MPDKERFRIRMVSDATTCHWTETASCCNSLNQKRSGPFGVGADC